MAAFHKIAIPHDNILKDRLTMEVFAVDFYDVFMGHVAEEFLKMQKSFFRKLNRLKAWLLFRSRRFIQEAQT